MANFPNLKLNNVDHIDLVKSIEEMILSFKPSRIFTHHPNDLNDDHRQISKACLVASKVFQRRNIFDVSIDIYSMEIQSATEWSNPFSESPFMPNVFVDVSDFIELKIFSIFSEGRFFVFSGNFLYLFDLINLLPLFPLI